MKTKVEEIKALESMVVSKLLEVGYPKESVILEYPISEKYRTDIAIIDRATQQPVMVVEVKAVFNPSFRQKLERKAYDMLKIGYQGDKIPVKYLGAIVTTIDETVNFIDYTEAIKENDYMQKIDNYVLPSYEELIVGTKQKVIKKEEQKQKKRIDTLKRLCWFIFPPVCGLILLLDALGVYTISNQRLILLGMCIALPLIPCFKEISIGEVSLKKEIEKQNDK